MVAGLAILKFSWQNSRKVFALVTKAAEISGCQQLKQHVLDDCWCCAMHFLELLGLIGCCICGNSECLSSVSLQLQRFYPNTWLLWCPHKQCTVKNLWGIDKNLLLNNVWTILVKITMKLIQIFFINSYYIPFMKMKNEKRKVFCFSVFYENEKRVRAFFLLFCFLLSLHYTYT